MSQTALTDVLRHLRRVFAAKAASGDSDSQLVKRFVASQDEAAFAVLVQRHGPLVLGVCQRLLGDAHAAEDAFQATFVVLSRRARSIRKRESVASWLYGVAQRIALDAKRRTAAPCRLKGQVMDQQHADPLGELTWQELRGVLDEEIARLPEKCRAAIVLCYLEGKSYDEAAKELGWPKSSLASRLSRGRELLRQQLTRRGIGLSAAALATVLSEKALGAPVAAFLTINTVKAATSLAARQAVAAGCLSEQAIILAEEAMKGMLGIKAKLVVLVLALGLAVGGAGLAGQYVGTDEAAREKRPVSNSAPQLPPAKAAQPKPLAAAVDLYGDPLPDGAIGRLGTVRWRHGILATSVGFAAGGKVVVSGGAGFPVAIWNAATGRLLHQPPGRYRSDFLAVSADGKSIFTDNLSVINVATGKELRHFGAPEASFRYLAISPDGRTAAAGNMFEKQQPKITLWDASTGKELHTLRGHTERIESVAFSPNGKLLASGSLDKTVRLWDVATGKQLKQFDADRKKPDSIAFASIAFAPNGRVLAAAAVGGVIQLLDVATGNELQKLKFDEDDTYAVVYSPDGKLIASSGSAKTIRVWDAATGKELRKWLAFRSNSLGLSLEFSSLAFSPDGKMLVAAGGYSNTIWRWETATGKAIDPPTGHTALIKSLNYTPDGKGLLSGGLDHTIVEWDLATFRERRQLFNETSRPSEGDWFWIPIGYSLDGSMVAASRSPIQKPKTDATIHIWSPASGKGVCTLIGHKDAVKGANFCPDGKLLASLASDGIRLWNLAAGKELYHLPTNASAFAFSHDGKMFAYWGADKAIHVCNTATGNEIRQWDGGEPEPIIMGTLAFAPDDRSIVSEARYVVRVVDVATGKPTLPAGKRPPGNFRFPTFSPSGRIIAVADAQRLSQPNEDVKDSHSIVLWEVLSGQEIRRIEVPQTYVKSLAFSPDSRTLASGGGDSTILLWDMTYGAQAAKAKSLPLTAAQLDALWTDLAGDAAQAEPAIWALGLAPPQSLPFLKKHMRPMPPTDPLRLAKLLDDLDSNTFAVRQKATQALEELGETAEGALRQLLRKNPPLEVRQRVEQILEKRTPDVIRTLRAIEAVEQMGTPEARQLLETLAKEAPNPRVAAAAAAALRRLAKRSSSTP